MDPEAGGLRPAQGQFIYLRGSAGDNAHPYTVSAYHQDTGTLSITAKLEGSQTARLQDVQPGDRLLLDGPYGVFTRLSMATELPVVMIAGGIGITPFRRLWRTLERDRNREAHLVYANQTYRDISYPDELAGLEHVHVIHVLEDEPDFEGETGMVSAELLERNLPGDLSDYQFLICGPAPMVMALEEELTEAGVPTRQVSHELFQS